MTVHKTLDDLYQRHLSHTDKADWSYHQLLPWEQGVNLGTTPWATGQGTLSPELTIAVETALLTEINLPWFTAGLLQQFETAPTPLQRFVKTWTAEEDQHSRILDIYLLLSRNGDPVQRHQRCRQVLRDGWSIGVLPETSVLGVMVYTTLQECATRVFYQNLAHVSRDHDPNLGRVLRAVAKDETLHFAFYRDAVRAYLDDDPNRIETVCRVVPKFTMPGAAMADFPERMRIVARYGGYGIPEYLHQVVQPVLQYWGVFEHQVGSDTERARQCLRHYVDRLVRAGHRVSRPLSS